VTAVDATCFPVDACLAKKNLFDCPSYFSGSVDGSANTATGGCVVLFRRLRNRKTTAPTRMTPSATAAPSAASVPVDIPFEEGGEETGGEETGGEVTPLSVAVVGPPRSTVAPVPVTEELVGEDSPLVE
jgi:hypothetical protein